MLRFFATALLTYVVWPRIFLDEPVVRIPKQPAVDPDTKRDPNNSNSPRGLPIPRGLPSNLLWLPDKARSMSIHIAAGRGSGKSRLLGRILAFLDYVRGVPLVIWDPVGATIDNFIDKLTRLPREVQERSRIWDRIIYVDFGNSARNRIHMHNSADTARTVSFPLYFRLGDESLYQISSRYVDAIRKLDPALVTASVEGMNALTRIAVPTGMVLSALGYQATETPSLLNHTEAWVDLLSLARSLYPDEAGPAVDFFLNEYLQWDQKTRARRAESFLVKLNPLILDPSARAMYGGAQPGIRWDEVVRKRQAVLLDFRHLHDVEARRFAMLWTFSTLLEYVKHRGPGHNQIPISIIIDELAAMMNVDPATANVFADMLDELINVISRNYMLWLTIAHQEMYQFGERLQKTLLSMGTQILGSTSDMEAALSTARTFYRVDPYKVKRYEPVYGSVMGFPEVLDYRPIEFSVEEQQLLKSYKVKDQPAFHFLVRPAPGEGDTTGAVYPVTIRNFDKDIWVNEELVGKARSILSNRSGVPVSDVLAEIDLRLPSGAKPATIDRYANHLSVERPAKTTTSSKTSSTQSAETSAASDEDEDTLREEKHV
jgi:hypothetical protein